MDIYTPPRRTHTCMRLSFSHCLPAYMCGVVFLSPCVCSFVSTCLVLSLCKCDKNQCQSQEDALDWKREGKWDWWEEKRSYRLTFLSLWTSWERMRIHYRLVVEIADAVPQLCICIVLSKQKISVNQSLPFHHPGLQHVQIICNYHISSVSQD